MSDGHGVEQTLLWWETLRPRQPGAFVRLMRALLDVIRPRPAVRLHRGGGGDGDTPGEGAGVPARPKRPAPTLLAAAEVDVPRDAD